jgi:branched-chain amino acid transport system ATP-binding protein
MTETLLEVKKLTSGYGKFPVINDISFSVPSQKIVSVIGPNGSGKSTLLKTIMGLATIFEGNILLDGYDITGKEPEEIARSGVGYVPQLSNVFSDMTVKENLQIGLISCRDDKSSTMNDIFSLFPQLSKKLDLKAGLLSGGERQMLAISRALASKPKLLILDEPSAGLSPSVTQILFESISQINSLGVTVLIVEQNVQKAIEISNSVIVLVQGRKVYDGPTDEISSEEKIAELFLGRSLQNIGV